MKYKDAYMMTVHDIRQDKIRASRVLLIPCGFLCWWERLVCFLTGVHIVEY